MAGEGDPFSFGNQSPGFLARWFHLRRQAEFDRTALRSVGSKVELAYLIVFGAATVGAGVTLGTTAALATAVVLGVPYALGRLVMSLAWRMRKREYRQELRQARRENRS